MSTSSIRMTRRTRAVAAPMVGAALLFGGVACSESEGPDEGATLEDVQPEQEGAVGEAEAGLGEQEGLTEQEIAEAPNQAEDDSAAFFGDQAGMVGQTVTVSGEVVEIFNPNAFLIGEGELATLVLRDPSVELIPTLNTTAQVTGEVGTFVLVDVERELGIDLVDEDFVQFEQAPFITATNINLLDSES
jgi:hypothetical protein